MNPVWWFRGKNRHGDYTGAVHVLRDGRALCGTFLFDSSYSTMYPDSLGGSPCKRCEKALVKLAPPPGEDRLCQVYRMGGSDFRSRLYVVRIDNEFFNFDMAWYRRKYSGDPDDWGIGALAKLDAQVRSRLSDTHTIITVPASWRPANVRHTKS